MNPCISFLMIRSLALATFIFTYIVANAENSIFLVKASESISPASSVDDLHNPAEYHALLQTGWWTAADKYNNSHCSWPGVTCNDVGNVTEISLHYAAYEAQPFENLNLSGLPNLVRLDLSRAQLSGSIPEEIGGLSKLTHLDLSQNNLRVLVAMLALACLNAKPKCRPTMKQVSQLLLARRRTLTKHFREISLGQLMILDVYKQDSECEIGITEI